MLVDDKTIEKVIDKVYKKIREQANPVARAMAKELPSLSKKLTAKTLLKAGAGVLGLLGLTYIITGIIDECRPVKRRFGLEAYKKCLAKNYTKAANSAEAAIAKCKFTKDPERCKEKLTAKARKLRELAKQAYEQAKAIRAKKAAK
jgi:hypothetical protein